MTIFRIKEKGLLLYLEVRLFYFFWFEVKGLYPNGEFETLLFETHKDIIYYIEKILDLKPDKYNIQNPF